MIICTSQEIGATCRKAIQNVEKKWDPRGTSLAIQWSRLHASTTGGKGSIPGQGNFTCCVVRPKKERKKTTALIHGRFGEHHGKKYFTSEVLGS